MRAKFPRQNLAGQRAVGTSPARLHMLAWPALLNL